MTQSRAKGRAIQASGVVSGAPRRMLMLGRMFALARMLMSAGVMRMMVWRMGRRAAAARRMVAWVLGIVVVACHALVGAPRRAVRVPCRRLISSAAHLL